MLSKCLLAAAALGVRPSIVSRLLPFRACCSSTTQQPAVLLSHDIDPATSQPSGVVIVQLNRKATLNSLTPAVGTALETLLRTLPQDKRVRALVITGSGRAFSAGGDYAWLGERSRDTIASNRRIMRAFYNSNVYNGCKRKHQQHPCPPTDYLVLRSMPFPVVSAINGHAVGAGLCLALACDVRCVLGHDWLSTPLLHVVTCNSIVAAKAKLGLNFLRLGMCPAFGATQLLPALVGHEHAARLLLTGDLILGNEAGRIGLASEVHERAEDVLPAALALARRMAAVSPTCMHDTLRVLRRRAEGAGGLDAVLEEEAWMQAASMVRDDFREGLRAARDKDVPSFCERQ